MKISIDLNPIVTLDAESGMFIAKFPEIPNAISYDENPEKAILNLISIFEVLLKEQKELVFERIIKKHVDTAFAKESSYELVRILDTNNSNEKMELQMISE